MQSSPALAFALIYLTFFLDNVLLTVLVPIIPDWIRGEALALWAAQDAPLAGLLNHTVSRITHDPHRGSAVGGSQAVVGLVLGAKAAAQLVTAPLAGAAVSRRGAAPVLRAATAALALAALGFTVCSGAAGGAAALCVGGARVAHGAGAALGGVAGLALAARALPPRTRHTAISALLGAVALGVLVGYPFGGATYALWSRGAPFLLLAAALLADLAMQYMFLDVEEYNQPQTEAGEAGSAEAVSPLGVVSVARRGATAACAGCVLLTTSVMAALEPCLPLWLAHKFHPARWQTGVVFVPDSVGYLLAASGGDLARRLGAERVALAGQVTTAPALPARGGSRVAGVTSRCRRWRWARRRCACRWRSRWRGWRCRTSLWGWGWARRTRRWCRRCWRAAGGERRRWRRCCRRRARPPTRWARCWADCWPPPPASRPPCARSPRSTCSTPSISTRGLERTRFRNSGAPGRTARWTATTRRATRRAPRTRRWRASRPDGTRSSTRPLTPAR
ncbi:synaptic vesicular amine transporter-like [Anticarsia gemmatalis]|uniref:synaptic vesicular amine transporter-like n=1 Tax=Anticarsia gemmatalis TaxID=129554 RepID=UPI003F757413